MFNSVIGSLQHFTKGTIFLALRFKYICKAPVTLLTQRLKLNISDFNMCLSMILLIWWFVESCGLSFVFS